MKFSENSIPSNKKFGFFFTLVFLVITAYFFIKGSFIWIYLLGAAILILVITIFKPNSLLMFNKLWVKLGLVLGMIISPIILGMIFFGLFTPIAFLTKLRGRDELRLKIKCKTSHWISRKESITVNSFRRQF